MTPTQRSSAPSMPAPSRSKNRATRPMETAERWCAIRSATCSRSPINFGPPRDEPFATSAGARSSIVAELVDTAEVLASVRGEFAVARVVDRFNPDDASREFVVALFDVPPKCELGGAGSGDQNLSHVGDRCDDVAEERHIVGRVSGA